MTYSVAIRTIGKAGEKYKRLLDSIKNLIPQPEKVVVVLPEGYALPKERIGTETFIFSSKGMIVQRLVALKYITSDYTLFCDDDVEFDSDFVTKLLEPLETGEYSCSAGPLLSFFPPVGLKYFLASALGGACVMLYGRTDTYVRILKTGGWSYNRDIDMVSHKIYKTESLPGTCFMAKTEAISAIQLENEMWAERTGYAAFEDRVMIYKLLLNGYSTCVVSDALYNHNDAKTSVQEMRTIPLYARAFNHYVFWHRFIYSIASPIGKIWSKICIEYYIILQLIHSRLKRITGRVNDESINVISQGFRDARKFILTDEYKKLPSVIGEKS